MVDPKEVAAAIAAVISSEAMLTSGTLGATLTGLRFVVSAVFKIVFGLAPLLIGWLGSTKCTWAFVVEVSTKVSVALWGGYNVGLGSLFANLHDWATISTVTLAAAAAAASSKLSVCELFWLDRDAFVDLLEWVEGLFLEFSVALVGTLIIGLWFL